MTEVERIADIAEVGIDVTAAGSIAAAVIVDSGIDLGVAIGVAIGVDPETEAIAPGSVSSASLVGGESSTDALDRAALTLTDVATAAADDTACLTEGADAGVDAGASGNVSSASLVGGESSTDALDRAALTLADVATAADDTACLTEGADAGVDVGASSNVSSSVSLIGGESNLDALDCVALTLADVATAAEDADAGVDSGTAADSALRIAKLGIDKVDSGIAAAAAPVITGVVVTFGLFAMACRVAGPTVIIRAAETVAAKENFFIKITYNFI